jgi:two-component sensor histidine kinase
MKHPRINITQKFVFYLMIISIIPLLIVGMSSFVVSDAILQKEASQYSSAVVANQRDYIELQLEQIEGLMANISSVEEITNVLGDEAMEEDAYNSLATQAQIGYILNGYSNLRGLVSIDIFSVGGTHYHVGDTLDVANIRTDVRNDILKRTAASDQIVLWSGIEDNVNVNSAYDKVLTAAQVLHKFNPDTLQSEAIALFLVNMRLDEMSEHLDHIDLGVGSYLMVIDAQDRIIYHPDDMFVGESITNFDMDISDLFTEDVGEFITTVNGQKVFVSYARLNISDWVVFSLIPLETLTAKTAVIRNNTLVILLVSFLVVGMFAWLYNRDVVQPIRKITSHFQALEKGSSDLDVRMEPHGSDEIGELVQWFNAFITTLAARREAELQIEASLREKEALLQEVHHRVKNNLQVVSSLLSLQGSRFDDPEVTAVFKDSQNRIQSMSLIHEKLYRSKDFSRINLGEYVHNLTTFLVRSYRLDTSLVDVAIDTDEIYISIDTAIPIGLLLNEIISNALKHAFPDGQNGKITILLHKEARLGMLIVRDNGIGIPNTQLADNTGTLGFQLIRTLIKQINADMEIDTENGTKFCIKFDLSTERST